MKHRSIISVLFLWSHLAFAQLLETEARSRGSIQNVGMNFSRNTRALIVERVLLDEVLAVNEHVRLAKYHILQGQVSTARKHLEKLDRLSKTQKGKLSHVITRYNAVLEFLDGNWRKSLAYLKDPYLNKSPNFSKICVLKVLMKIAAQDKKQLSFDWNRCKAENSNDVAKREQVWMDTIVNLTVGASEGLTKKAITKYNLKNIDNETLKVVVKLALYLNLESLIVNSIDELDYTVAEDDELRSLLGHILFRHGKLARAWKFIEGIDDVNTNNITGNIWALRGNSWNAFINFNLALMNKPDSQNATERMLPVAWELKQWKRGRSIVELQKVNKGSTNELQALSAAFDIQMSNFEDAKKTLFLIERTIGADTVLEIDQMSTYVGVKTNDKKTYIKHAQRACKAGDLTACWLLMAQLNWIDVSSLIENTEQVAAKTNLARELAGYDQEIAPFQEEEIYVDQRDIEELDEQLINLIKN